MPIVKKFFIICFVSFLWFFAFQSVIPYLSYGAVENLDEIVTRKSRIPIADWGPSAMEDPGNHHIWQPETLMYFDTITGHEVWRMTHTRDRDNFYHNDIGWSHWSADGKWLAFASDRDTKAFKRSSSKIWMIVQTDGSHLSPAIGGSFRGYSSLHDYFHWSPQLPDTYYATGERGNGLSLTAFDVYKNTISEQGITRNLLFSTNIGNGNARAKKLSKTISGDGKKILLRDAYIPSGPYYLYPCTVLPEPSARCDNLGGYNHMREHYEREHSGGLFLSGNEKMGYYIYLMPSGTSAWWRMSFTGNAPDGGPLYTPPGTKGEVIIQSSRTPPFPPWKNHSYWSHMTPDWWGNRIIFSNMEDNSRPGIAHLNVISYQYDTRSFLNDYGVQHNDWHGFTDYTVSSYTPAKKPNDGLGQRITSQRFNDASFKDILTVCFTHTRFNGGTAYSTLPRPFISPDGTKVAWTSEFLNASPNKNDIFWAVIRYPKPPVNISAQKVGNRIRLTWERPHYTSRGWPEEASDPPPKSKEIIGYHVWVSDHGETGWSEITTTAISTEFFEINQENHTTKYYAVTSEEHSRLESRNLSAIKKVTLDSNGNLSSSQQAPEGKIRFWITPPPPPTNVSVKPQSAPGQYRLNWTEPINSKIRYYNIYYSTKETPKASQPYRIASVPVGTSTYLDWLADPNQAAYYKITSVDRYGNEGDL